MGTDKLHIMHCNNKEVRLLCDPCPQLMQSLRLAEGIGEFDDYRSLLMNPESLARVAKDPKGRLCLAQSQDRIVAYCLIRPPAPDERWAEMTPPVLNEVLAETARGWRGRQIMTRLLALLFETPLIEDLILYIVGYSWTWDLKGAGVGAQPYRQALIGLLAPHAFKEYPTNEPNVSLREENLFMARIGSGIEKKIQKRFTSLLFGIRED